MNIGFVNFTPLVYDVETPYNEPLGGSESSLCYLAEHLARMGDEITVYWGGQEYKNIRGVTHIPRSAISPKTLSHLDVLIVQNTPNAALDLKKILPKKTRLILWLQHAGNQPSVMRLMDQEYKDAFSLFVFVSRWQLEDYVQRFGLDRAICVVLRNAIAPTFEHLFDDGGGILAHKTEPPVLVYTSTPFRGLSVLFQAFPLIRKHVPTVQLHVYSSMKVYQGKELPEYEKLYKKCIKTPGVEYQSSVSQHELAQHLRQATLFAYPSTFQETSCISVMEAMAAGLQVVTTKDGALPETAAGFGELLEPNTDHAQFAHQFARRVVQCLEKRRTYETEQVLIRQLNVAHAAYTWKQRATEWKLWL